MVKKLYWATRLIGYFACLGGIFTYLAHLQDDHSSGTQAGLLFVYGGFIAFFVSYVLRAWLRFGPGRKTDEE